MRGPKRLPWQNEADGSLSPDWVVALIMAAVLVAAGFGFWFNDMYAKGYGIFSP